MLVCCGRLSHRFHTMYTMISIATQVSGKTELGERRTMNMHPPLLCLYCAIYLYLVHTLPQAALYCLMQHLSEFTWQISSSLVYTQQPNQIRESITNSPFSRKSLSPASPPPSTCAGSHPSTTHESATCGVSGRNDRAKTARSVCGGRKR